MVGGWLLHLVLPLFCLLPGLPILWSLGRPASHAATSLGLFLFRAVLAGFLLHSAVALILAELGLFSVEPFLVVEGIGLLLIVALGWHRKLLLPRPAWEDLLPLGLLLLAALLLGEPHPAILGGTDPGVYIGIGMNILRAGSLRTVDPIWAAMDPQVAREFLFANQPGMSIPYHRLPGFYILDISSGVLMPQFYHLYPLWLALSFGVAGLPEGLFITPVLASWSLLAIYYAGRAIVGKWSALAGSLLLGLNSLFIWLGRHPTSEMPAQFLLFAGMYALVTFLDSNEHDRPAGVLAGAALGGLLHTRVDSILVLALIGAWLAFRLLSPGRRWSGLHPFLLSFGIFLGHWGLYLALFTWGYTIDVWVGALKFLLAPIARPMAFLGVLGFLLLLLLNRRGRLPVFLPILRKAVAGGILVLSGWACFAWPYLAPPQVVGFYAWNGWQFYPVSQGQNFLRLVWYLSPLGMALGLAGLCRLALRDPVRRAAFVVGLVLLYGLLYTHRNIDYPVLPYTMRRHFVVVIPALMLMAGYALYRLSRVQWQTGRAVAAALLLLQGWTFFEASQLPLQVNDFSGIENRVAELAGRFAPADILLFTDVASGTALAFPLQYLYQRPSFVLQRPQPDSRALYDQVQAWWEEGRNVYILVSEGESRLSQEVFSLEWLGTFPLRWWQVEYTLDRLPEKVVEQEARYNLYRLADAREQPKPPTVDVGAGDYPYLVEGFWAPEQTPEGMTFRWTNGNALVELPGRWFVSPGALTLTLGLQPARGAAESSPFLEVWLGGVLLERFNPSLEMREYAIPISPDLGNLLAKQGSTLLRLKSSTWVPASAGLSDTRQLGVALDRIAVQTSP